MNRYPSKTITMIPNSINRSSEAMEREESKRKAGDEELSSNNVIKTRPHDRKSYQEKEILVLEKGYSKVDLQCFNSTLIDSFLLLERTIMIMAQIQRKFVK